FNFISNKVFFYIDNIDMNEILKMECFNQKIFQPNDHHSFIEFSMDCQVGQKFKGEVHIV
ncbi:hypothetical protein GLOIN_2v1653719, partial [Rhizophagus irregularis DAOM 181602=DAOM 197198]